MFVYLFVAEAGCSLKGGTYRLGDMGTGINSNKRMCGGNQERVKVDKEEEEGERWKRGWDIKAEKRPKNNE